MRIFSTILSILASVFAVAGASAQEPAATAAAFVLSVDREGLFFATVEGASQRLEESAVRDRARAVLRGDIGATFTVEADAGAPVQRVTQAAALLQQGGATKIAFRTKRADAP